MSYLPWITEMMRDVAPSEEFDTVRLRDGTTGYYTRRPDDCMMSAVATVLQTPDAPDLRIDARLRAGVKPEDVDRVARQELDRWLVARGLRMVVHERAPVDSERCIGVVAFSGWFRSHCLVLSRGRLLHDAAARATSFVNSWLGVRLWDVTDVTWGMTFEQLKTNRKGAGQWLR